MRHRPSTFTAWNRIWIEEERETAKNVENSAIAVKNKAARGLTRPTASAIFFKRHLPAFHFKDDGFSGLPAKFILMKGLSSSRCIPFH
jgi:hypothetical protein